MRVLLIKDVYKLGRAGEIKKVAAGYGRNFLIPKGFAIPATPGAMQQVERITVKATERRAILNEELSDVAEVLEGKTLLFSVKAGETGRLYGSVSDEDIINTIKANYEIELEKRQVESEPIRQLGTFIVPIHLTMDLVPEITVIVHREGEIPGEEEEEEKKPEATETVSLPEEVMETETPAEEKEMETPEEVEASLESEDEAEVEAPPESEGEAEVEAITESEDDAKAEA